MLLFHLECARQTTSFNRRQTFSATKFPELIFLIDSSFLAAVGHVHTTCQWRAAWRIALRWYAGSRSYYTISTSKQEHFFLFCFCFVLPLFHARLYTVAGVSLCANEVLPRSYWCFPGESVSSCKKFRAGVARARERLALKSAFVSSVRVDRSSGQSFLAGWKSASTFAKIAMKCYVFMCGRINTIHTEHTGTLCIRICPHRLRHALPNICRRTSAMPLGWLYHEIKQKGPTLATRKWVTVDNRNCWRIKK